LKKHKKPLTNTYQTIAIVTPYWRPGENFTRQILDAIEPRLKNGDIITISEKAISTASGNIIDENSIEASSLARFLAKHWMHLIWGYVLGPICHLRKKTISRFRTYPVNEGGKHKQLALRQAGFLQALMHGSEGAIDGSNLPYSYVSLPPKDAQKLATQIRQSIRNKLCKDINVMIIDTDKTYSIRNFHFTPRPDVIHGIQSKSGILGYVSGRFLRLKQRATPVATSDPSTNIEETLQIADAANKARGFGAGRNVWDMAEAFDVRLTEVTWEMLERVEHKPIVIVRRT
jgi:F420-0:gamma-glutamyl ligase-like protein